jgi:hypothetical protein
MDKYLDDLRRNRSFKATEIIQSSLEKTGIRRSELDKSLFQKISLIQNRTRGPLFELMAESIIGKVFEISEFDRQKVFKTPFGDRKIDLFVPDKKIAIEVKSGYARSTAFTRKQVKKDRHIIEHQDEVDRVIWFCFRGATSPLIRYMASNSIEYCDIEYDSFGEQISEAEKKVVIRV